MTTPMIPTAASDADLDKWLAGQPNRNFQREQLAFAAMGYLGMCRHPYLSADWIAHNELYSNAVNSLGRIVNPKAQGGAARPIVERMQRDMKARGFHVQAEAAPA